MENYAMKKSNRVPLQVYLEPEQDKIVSHLARSSGTSKAAIIRSCIQKFIDGLPPENDPALRIMNLGNSKKSDIAQRHDEYLERVSEDGKEDSIC